MNIEKLSVRRDGVEVLHDVSIALEPGRVVAIVGPNGSGKTTLLDEITSRCEPGAVGRVFQGSPLPATMTVEEIAALACGRADAPALLARFGLGGFGSTFVAELSTGMRRILDLALALSRAPEILLLDEPSSGLAQAEISSLCEMVLEARERSAAVAIVEHDASVVRAVADEVVVLEYGRVVARKTTL